MLLTSARQRVDAEEKVTEKENDRAIPFKKTQKNIHILNLHQLDYNRI